MPDDILMQDIKFLSGVGPKRSELLNKELNIFTFKDLLYYFPYKYIDRTTFYKINEINPDLSYIQLKGKISHFKLEGKKYRQRLVATFIDDTGSIELVWFQGIKWIQSNYKINVPYVIFGKPTLFNNSINIAHPEIEDPAKQQETIISSSLQALYNTSEKLKNHSITTRTIHKLQNTLLQKISNQLTENLPDYVIKKNKLLPLQESLLNIHFPQSAELLKKAEFRLKFDELFYIQLNILKLRSTRQSIKQGFIFPTVGNFLNTFYSKNLPFELTNAQKRVIKEIRKDLNSGVQMNRLLQGDVGSGKTLVALMVMLIALDNGFQACLMVPTEILANQHLSSLTSLLKGLNIEVKLLTGSTKKSERKKIDEQLQDGSLHILIGTHALIEDTVQFKNLGMVIIDEQHRFGVAQRAKLWSKNPENPPHILVMTATPIPRTLAMTLYGDLDVSIIDELPPGRKPIKTSIMDDSKRLRLFGFMKEQIKAGRQIYVVYPLIKESEKMDFKNLEDGYFGITEYFPPPNYFVSIVHGKLKASEKDLEMQRFIEGKTNIMVATTVIEVGVNIPNASVMVIESAERFGLSQLHQLRGRVGRGAEQSHCILMTSYKLSSDARKRLDTMVRTNDGFEIAEADLKLRGPGDMEGTQQSGVAFDLKIAHLGKDDQILQIARNTAMDILDVDPDLKKTENLILSNQLNQIKKDRIDWSNIS